MTAHVYIILSIILLAGVGFALALQRYRKDRKDKRRQQIIVFAPSHRDDR
ncbi:hypothetical protein [Sphingomonas gilva]|nr:hypothetical protein [Sphingomonas gilva]